MKPWIERVLREWLVIENAHARAVFRDDNEPRICGYIPREAAEKLLGRSLVEEDGRITWFNSDESAKMRAHPEWRETLPPMPSEGEYL